MITNRVSSPRQSYTNGITPHSLLIMQLILDFSEPYILFFYPLYSFFVILEKQWWDEGPRGQRAHSINPCFIFATLNVKIWTHLWNIFAAAERPEWHWPIITTTTWAAAGTTSHATPLRTKQYYGNNETDKRKTTNYGRKKRQPTRINAMGVLQGPETLDLAREISEERQRFMEFLKARNSLIKWKIQNLENN